MNDDYSEREQSQLKHFALRRYLEAASKIIGTWKGFSYVDCCAGPWESRSQDYSDTSFGIAIEVLKESQDWLRERGKTPRFRALLIEQSPRAFEQLSSFAAQKTGQQLNVEVRNWDFTEHTSDIVRFVTSPPSFGFLFIDPTGWTPAEVRKLKPLMQIRPSEILINFMSSFIVRFLHDERTDMEEILGSDYRKLRDLPHEEQEDEAVRRYCELVRRQGEFKYVCALPVMKRDQDAIHFFLIYGTRHEKGVEVFKYVERKTEEQTKLVRALHQQSVRPNLDLFTPDVLYKREERYRRLAARRKFEAESALQRLLTHRKQVSYDDCWAETLQYSAVYESDLRNWLKDYESKGIVRILGGRKPGETLKRGSGHTILKP